MEACSDVFALVQLKLTMKTSPGPILSHADSGVAMVTGS